MAFKSVSFFLLTTELCMIGMVLGAASLDASFVDDYDIEGYILSTGPRYKRDLNDLEYLNNREPVGFIPEYLKVWDKLMPDMKTKMEIIKGNLFLPRSSENYSSETIPPSFVKVEQLDSSLGDYMNEKERETYQGLDIRPQGISTEVPVILETQTPDSYLVQGTGNQVDWKKGGEDQVPLNTNSDMYKLIGNMNSNFNEEVFDINHLETGTDSLKDGVHGCYKQCLQSCYGTSSAAPISYCESAQHSNPLIININSECLTHPRQRFSHRYGSKPKLSANALKFKSLPRGFHKYSSCPFSEIPHIYY